MIKPTGIQISLIKFGENSKVEELFIEKISHAVGGLCKPWQTRRVARADADAAITAATADIEIKKLQSRGLYSLLAEAELKQKNIESITAKAIPHLTHTADPTAVEDDWVTNFFDKCRLISDDEMQDLWARILSSEANTPGSYSKRTVNLLGSIDKRDALMFAQLCGFAWHDGDSHLLMIFDHRLPIYKDHGVAFPSLTHLDAIGLIQLSTARGYAEEQLPAKLRLSYFGQIVNLGLNQDQDDQLRTGEALLTQTGSELASVCQSTPVAGFVEFMIDRWMKQGIVLSSPYPKTW